MVLVLLLDIDVVAGVLTSEVVFVSAYTAKYEVPPNVSNSV
jgi:hypothetical protein